jgi:uncharacterized protein (DUF2147 family)
MHKKILALLGATLVLGGPPGYADEPSPVGLWKTISDTTGKPSGIVEVFLRDGEYTGRIVQSLERDAAAVCEQCTDARKDQPIVGMVFLSGLKRSGDEYSGGEILDPHNGKVYRARMRLADGGAKLEVRGYIGISLLGRTQTWLREK